MGASQRSVIKKIYIYICDKKKYYARETKIVTSRENDDDIRISYDVCEMHKNNLIYAFSNYI